MAEIEKIDETLDDPDFTGINDVCIRIRFCIRLPVVEIYARNSALIELIELSASMKEVIKVITCSML